MISAVEQLWDSFLQFEYDPSLLFALGNIVRSNLIGISRFNSLKPSQKLFDLVTIRPFSHAIGKKIMELVRDIFNPDLRVGNPDYSGWDLSKWCNLALNVRDKDFVNYLNLLDGNCLITSSNRGDL